MKLLLCCLVSILISGNLAYGSDEAVSKCYLDTSINVDLENIIAKNIGQQLFKRITAHLAPYKVGILIETLNNKVSITGGVRDSAAYNLIGSVKTTTNQELMFSAENIYIEGVVTADTWNPDGSAVNARCQITHRISAHNFSIYNAKTRKVILTVNPEDIKPFDVYKM